MTDRPSERRRGLAALTPPSARVPGPADAGFSVPSAFVAGTVFAGRYRMVAWLGTDSQGEVWRADDLILGTQVALKLIVDATAEARARILTEVRLARQVTHPAVCRMFDVGEADGTVFYSREVVDGEDLGTLLRRAGRLPAEKVVEIGQQLCDGLAAAHARGVFHGGLNATTVLIDDDGIVRIIDFGVASAADLDAPASQDIHAAGLLLYELLVGQPAWAPGAEGSGRPVRPSRLVPDVDRRLERIILQALSPDPRRRPMTAAAMGDALAASPPASRRGWRAAAALAATLLLAALAVVGWRLRPTGGAVPLSNRDTLVLADVTNTTGEAVFDGTLKVALAVALEQSPFLKVFPDERVRETLQLMRRPPNERVTRDVAREIAEREQLRAVVSGSIGALGSHYVLAVDAVDARTGDIIAREQVEAGSREEVLTSLGSAVSRLRSTLGESVASIERFDAPLARATTASLDALHAYSLALDDGRVNLRVEAIPHLQRAIELDPQFAMAQALLSGVYANTNRSADAPAFARRAFELRDRVSERERFFISWRYYIDATQDWSRALALAESWAATYPREPFAFNSLGLASAAFGRHEPAIAAFESALRLDPRFVPPHGNLVGSLIALGRLDEARVRLREARARGIDGLSQRRAAFRLAFLDRDTAAMDRALADARQLPESALPSLDWEARAAAVAGRVQTAHGMFADAVQQAMRSGQREVAAQWAAEDAEVHALVGQCDLTARESREALDRSRDNFTLERATRALALCGGDVTALTAELTRRFPDATLTQRIHLRLVDAILADRRGETARALDRLATLSPLEVAPSAELWPGYLRGLVYLRMKDGARAGAEFQRVIEHRSVSPTSLLYPLATLGAARAAAQAGDTASARRQYQRLFELWSAADPALAPLADARREYAALR